MSKSSRLKETHEKSSRLSLSNSGEGTAARTRPFSFEEIMIRRENKKFEYVKEGAIEAGNISKEGTVENVSDRFESERVYRRHKDSSPVAEKCLSEKLVKGSSRKKEESTSMKEDILVKGKDRESRESEIKPKDKENREISYKAKLGTNDKKIHDRRKNEWSSGGSENEAEKKHSRDLVGKDRYADRGIGKSERESKRKYRNGDDEKNRDQNSVKKHDPGKQHDLDISERKERKESSKSRDLDISERKERKESSTKSHDLDISERKERKESSTKSRDLDISERKERKESSKSHYEESRVKRRRSRSREREDRIRRSISLSPRAHKRTSYHGGERRELSSHSLKDRSRRQNSDVDRSRVSSNGSSSHHRRHVGYASGLGGYSPRKRRIETGAKTPSPSSRSPEKKSAGWDLPPVGTDDVFSGLVPSDIQSDQDVTSTVNELVRDVSVASTTAKPLSGVLNAFSTKNNTPIDSVQLTQATRPMRRLYVENVTASASEKALMECFNNFLMSFGVNRIQGIQPCINCIIHKEKGQALVEFLTPEDASAALSFDGSSFSGSILKIRRPKDFVEVATGDPEKSVAVVDTISDTVKDSPNRIFIGGISNAISSEMLMEIVSAFGNLKAYHFEVNEELNQPCAFLEYVDQSATLKACAGLNGMKLGGQVLTVVQAISNASFSENAGNPLCYGIPEPAQPLLKQPTQVLKLKNVFNPEVLSSLSEPEVQEVLEDIRLECARFGTVKSVNVVKCSNSQITTTEACEDITNKGSAQTWQVLLCDDKKTNNDTSEKDIEHEFSGTSEVEFPSEVKGAKEEDDVDCFNDDKPAYDFIEDKSCQSGQLDSNMVVEDVGCENISDSDPQELANQLNSPKDQLECHEDKVAGIIQSNDISSENKLMAEDQFTLEETDSKLQEASVALVDILATESDVIDRVDNEKRGCDLEHVFEPGCVFVEYGRTEASCTAAHCLHGRVFDDQVVTVEYVALDLYRVRFPK